MRQYNTFKTNTKTRFLPFIFMFTCLILSSCADNPLQPVSSEEEQRIKAELDDRSFRQFDPSKDADKRKGVIKRIYEPTALVLSYIKILGSFSFPVGGISESRHKHCIGF